MLIPVMLSTPVPVLVSVVGRVLDLPIVVLGKRRADGKRCTMGLGPTPLPLKRIDCGLPGALSLMVTEAVRVPVWVGVKVTLIAQLAPTARLEPQVLVSLN